MSLYKKKLTSTELYNALVQKVTAEAKKKDIIKCLDDGANVNERFANDSNNTPLHISVIKGDLDIVKLLLQRGANINYKNSEGKTAVDIAEELDSDIGLAIIELLGVFEAERQINEDVDQNTAVDISIIQHNDPQMIYHKRAGTSGIKEQLYESKLLSLVLVRASLNKKFDEFFLGTCLNGIGAFNEVCIRYTQNGKEGVVFLRTKHTRGVKKAKVTLKDLWREDGDFSLYNYYYSFLGIMNKLTNKTNDDDALFKLITKNVKHTFVVYTTAEIDLQDKILVGDDSLDETARDLISSGDYTNIYRYKYNDEEVELLSNTALIKYMIRIASVLAYSIRTENYDILFNESLIRKYHVVLAHRVIKISEVTEDGYRIGNFRKEFLNNIDQCMIRLRFELFLSMITAVKIEKAKLCELIDNVCKDPTVLPLSKLMQNVITEYDFQYGTVNIIEECYRDVNYKLLKIKISHDIYAKAYILAVKETLGRISFKLPSKFGNIDIAVNDEENCDKILAHLAENLIEIIQKSDNPNPNKLECRSIVIQSTLDVHTNFDEVLASAVGNLLILNETNNFYKINTNEQSLGKNAKTVLKILKSEIKYLDFITLDIQIPYLPKLTLGGDEEDKNRVKIFFNNLWFYTCQAKEDVIKELTTEAIQDYYVANTHERRETTSIAQYDAIYFIIHDAVQRWWMADEKSFYLKNNRELIDRLLKEFFENSLLNIISYMFVNRIRKYDIKFNRDAVDYFGSQVGPEATILITEVNVLTGIKITQCYHNLNNYAYIDLNDITCLSKTDYYTIINDLKNIKLKALIILYEEITIAKTKIFRRLTEKSITKNFILVTNEKSAEKLRLYITRNTFVTVKDVRNDLSDLAYISQEKVLDKVFMFQGQSVKFSTIMKPGTKILIKAKILQKIINNEIIDIGKILTNPYYEEIKRYYIHRSLRRQISISKEYSMEPFAAYTRRALNEEKIHINTLEALEDTVVIVGAAGMGKSTFLTNLSIETKRVNPSVWIERINLLDQTKELYRLQKNETVINKIDAIKFVCKALLSKNLTRFSIKPTPVANFDLGINNGVVVLMNTEKIDYLVLFELEMFIYCYNQGNTILLFDGFDEICPHYHIVMTEILKCLVTRCSSDTGSDVKQRMWITSRSYNNIMVTLEKEFGVAYNLETLSRDEVGIFMNIYLEINIKINQLNLNQFKNIDSFFDYLKEYCISYNKLHWNKGQCKDYKSSSTFLRLLYKKAMNYFVYEFNRPFTADKYTYIKKWTSIYESQPRIIKETEIYTNKHEAANLTYYTPLHMYIIMEYFINQIKSTNENDHDNITKKWDIEMSTLSFYKYFIETKLKKIRFEEKNQVDLFNPDVMMMYEKELKEFMNKHKKLAFYATFKDDLNEILTTEDIQEIHNIIQGMKAGREKTGIVDCILSSGIPKFVHISIQEFLAVEYMADLLKRKKRDQTKLWVFILDKISDGLLDFFDSKMELDEELINVITDIETKEAIFKDFIIRYCYSKPTLLQHAVDKGWKTTTEVLVKAIADIIYDNNIEEFTLFIAESGIFKSSLDFGWNKVLRIILNRIRRVDASKLSELIPGVNINLYNRNSNNEIIKEYKWQLMKLSKMVIKKEINEPRLRHNSI